VNTSEIMVALEARYADASWAFLPQVRSTTGAVAARTADALAMGLWPSRGLELHGFEVKASRTDWIKELKNPSKAEEICQFCDRWWVVIGSRTLVLDSELPPTWGLIVPRGEKLIIKVPAPKLDALPVDRGFLAAILRRAQEWVRPDEIQDAEVEAAYEKGKRESSRTDRLQAEHYKSDKERLQRAIADFEKQSGICIPSWDGGRIGDAVRHVLSLNGDNQSNLLGDVFRLGTRLRELADKADELPKLMIDSKAQTREAVAS